MDQPQETAPRCAEWTSGVGGAQCDDCGRTTIVHPDARNADCPYPVCVVCGEAWPCAR